MSDLRNSLLGNDRKKLDTFEKLYDDCVYRIKRIKQKNDTLQKNAGTELQDEIAIEVQKQKQFIEDEIKQLREQMDEVERKYRDPEAKNKMKDIKKQAQRQIQRNKAVLREFVNKSFLNVKNSKRSRASGDGEDQGRYFEGGRTSVTDDDDDRNNNYNGNGYQPDSDTYYKSPNDQYLPAHNFQKNKQHQQSQLEIDYELEYRLEKQKNQLLQNVQKDAQKILGIVAQTGNIVAQADQMLDHITDNVVNANRNVIAANQKMQQASDYQKKAKKKYIIFAAIILFAVALAVGIILIVKL